MARTRYKGHELCVTEDYAFDILDRQNGKCALTGVPISIAVGTKYRTTTTASLDRIDSSKPYVEGNLQWLHKDVNRMKLAFPEERFIEVCNLVAAYRDNPIKTGAQPTVSP